MQFIKLIISSWQLAVGNGQTEKPCGGKLYYNAG
jgi:hypothetical protein